MWTALTAAEFGDAPAGSRKYRVFTTTVSAPYSGAEQESLTASATSQSLTPNTTYYRFVTGFTDWGDSHPSATASTHTLASDPAASGFSSMAQTSLTAGWTDGTPDNPAYTQYEVSRSSVPGFGVAVSTSYVVALSSSPTGLTANTTYYFRSRAVNIAGVATAFTATMATATLADAPAAPGFGQVFTSSVSFVWEAAGNPSGTQYVAQVSSDNFFSINATSATLGLSATFQSLVAGQVYYYRVYAVNHNSVASGYSTTVSTRSGTVADTNPPTTPGTPVADRQFSYDGTILFSWGPATASAGILDYRLLVGNTPGGNDVFDGNIAAAIASHTVSGLATGRTYYARVSARSNGLISGSFSDVSVGVPVFITAATSEIPKPFNWPNPFDPDDGPTQIGVFFEEPADVTLSIYTLQGRLVSETRQRVNGTGNQILTWNGRNGGGATVAPGGYIAVVKKDYGGRSQVQKLKIAVLY